jgi:hypothetical protein
MVRDVRSESNLERLKVRDIKSVMAVKDVFLVQK